MIRGTVAIVGRPNVGKSTLFNRLTRTRHALVDDQPGVTRDRIYGTVFWDDFHENGFNLIDTGGFETEGVYYQPFAENLVWRQTEVAISEADVILLILDAKSGPHPHDVELTRYLAKMGKDVLYVVNKIDGKNQETRAFEFHELGIDEMYPISASHGLGCSELAEAIEKHLAVHKDKNPREGGYQGTRVAIIGKPNAGKSSILNRLIGEERSVVSEIAGTTRDSLDTPMMYNKKPFVLVDTAGIRRRARIKEKIEGLSVMRSLQAVERADIVLLVLDAEQNLTDQDAKLADLAASQYKPLAIVINKWDLVKNKNTNTARDYAQDLKNKLRLMTHVPVIFTSCKTNQRVHKIMQVVEALSESYKKRATTRQVNDALRKIVFEHTPALIRKYSKRPKFYFATQVRTSPPTLVVFCNVAKEIQESYKRYMSNRFRELLDYGDSPLRLLFRAKGDISGAKRAPAHILADTPLDETIDIPDEYADQEIEVTLDGLAEAGEFVDDETIEWSSEPVVYEEDEGTEETGEARS